MDMRTSRDSPPKSTDLEGWREAIGDGRLSTFRLESITAAFQDLGQRDTGVRNALAKHLSNSVLTILRRRVGFNHPNKGEDIMFRVHGQIFEALLRPTSADGRSLREAFGPRLLFRLKDAIAAEARERRIPDETKLPEKHRGKKADHRDKNGTVVSSEQSQSSAEPDPTNDWAVIAPKVLESPLFDGVNDTNEQIDVDRILECVPDYRKRLAFQLFMDEVPYGSKKEDVYTIARALGISDKTARDWIKEVRQLLAENENVKHLKKRIAGDSI
jgi:hypothetical protein